MHYSFKNTVRNLGTVCMRWKQVASREMNQKESQSWLSRCCTKKLTRLCVTSKLLACQASHCLKSWKARNLSSSRPCWQKFYGTNPVSMQAADSLRLLLRIGAWSPWRRLVGILCHRHKRGRILGDGVTVLTLGGIGANDAALSWTITTEWVPNAERMP